MASRIQASSIPTAAPRLSTKFDGRKTANSIVDSYTDARITRVQGTGVATDARTVPGAAGHVGFREEPGQLRRRQRADAATLVVEVETSSSSSKLSRRRVWW